MTAASDRDDDPARWSDDRLRRRIAADLAWVARAPLLLADGWSWTPPVPHAAGPLSSRENPISYSLPNVTSPVRCPWLSNDAQVGDPVGSKVVGVVLGLPVGFFVGLDVGSVLGVLVGLDVGL